MTVAIPYFTLPKVPVLITDLEPFGILVATGVLIGSWIIRKRGEVLNLEDEQVRIFVGYLLVAGFVGAHVFDVIFYQPEALKKDPLLILKIWVGISSYGGFLGAVIGLAIFWRRRRPANTLALCDAVCTGLLPGFTLGRLGCTVVHDHPGAVTDFFLGFAYPAGAIGKEFPAAIRHNLGFYEFLYLAVMCAVFWIVLRWKRPVGFAVGFVCIAYAPVRFFLERFRLEHSDPRYIDFIDWTFAQYASVATLLGGVFIMAYAYRRGLTPEDTIPEPKYAVQPKAKALAKNPGKVTAKAKTKRKRKS